jgi:hypothetical protein
MMQRVAAQLECRNDTYEIELIMKKQQAKTAKVTLCLMALVVAQGCATHQDRVSGKSWSQIAAREQEQRFSTLPDGDWSLP